MHSCLKGLSNGMQRYVGALLTRTVRSCPIMWTVYTSCVPQRNIPQYSRAPKQQPSEGVWARGLGEDTAPEAPRMLSEHAAVWFTHTRAGTTHRVAWVGVGITMKALGAPKQLHPPTHTHACRWRDDHDGHGAPFAWPMVHAAGLQIGRAHV